MTPSRRGGRLLVVGFEGLRPPEWLFAFAARFGLGGIILFRRNCPSAAATREAVAAFRRRMAEIDPSWTPLVCVDQEGGRVERIREGVPHLPAAEVLAAGGQAAVAEAVRDQARALRGLGIEVNLAPVCDVRQQGESGAIGDRSYGTDPRRVAGLVRAHVEACLAECILPCAKHFPGHGAAAVDSHAALPVVGKSLDGFLVADLLPFAAAVAAGTPLVMAGHLLCPRVAAEPASLSPEWLSGVLRDRLGFRGAVLSDDMEMGALDGRGSPEEIAVRAVTAGCDALIYGRMLRPEVDLHRVAEALHRGVEPDRLDAAEERVRSLGRNQER